MDTETKLSSNVKVKKSGRKNEKKKKIEMQDTPATQEEECQQISQLTEEAKGSIASDTSTDSEDFNEDVNAFNYNTITSLAALKDIIQGDNNDTPETDSFFQHYFMNHCNNLSSRNSNSNSPFPFPERRRLSQCREEDEEDERKESDLLCPSEWLQIRNDITAPESLELLVKNVSFIDTTADQNANVVNETTICDSNVDTENKEPPKRTVMGARHKFLVTTTSPPAPTIERVLRAQVHNAHTVHFGTKGAEELRPNVRSIFVKQNLHHDKNYFDSSLIEIRSTVDEVLPSSEDIWIKRAEDKVAIPKVDPMIPPAEITPKTVLKGEEVTLRSAGKDVEKARSRSGTWGSATGSKPKDQAKKTTVRKDKEIRRSSDDRRQKREQRLDAAITRSTQSVGERKRRGSNDDGQAHPMYQQTIHGTSGVSRRPALFDILKSKPKGEAKKPPSIMQQVMAAVQNMTKSTPTTKDASKPETSKVEPAPATPVLKVKDGSAHPHSGSDSRYYHTISGSSSRRPSAMAKVMELFRGRASVPGQSTTTDADKRKAAREIISKVYDFMKKEASNKYATKLTDARWRTAQAAGVSESTVTRILRERKEYTDTMQPITAPTIESDITMETDGIVPIVPSVERTTDLTTEVDTECENETNTSHSNLVGRSATIFTSPMKKRRVRPRKNNFDEFDIGVIRRTIHNYHIEHRQFPTLSRLNIVLKDRIQFDGCLTTLRTLLLKLGYKWRKTENNRKVLTEKHDMQMLRLKYLKQVKSFRNAGRPIVYTDESYIHTNHVQKNLGPKKILIQQ